MKTFLTSLRVLFVLTLLTGGLYPLAVWAIGQAAFKHQAEGSVILRDGKPAGSELIAQKFVAEQYFHSRPSAGDFATVASGASNQARTSAKLAADVAARRAAFPADATVPADLLTASGSGLDPHLSPAAVRLQIERVAKARKLAPEKLTELIARLTETGGVLGGDRVNILLLNLALDGIR